MEILAIIPARGGSKGIPMKNIKKLHGKPLIEYTINASLNSKVNRTIVSTDNKKIAQIGEKLGSEISIRPKKLATDKSQIEPVMTYVLEQLKLEKYIPDLIILLQNTSPLRTSKHINHAIEFFIKNEYDSIFSGYFSHNMIWQIKNKSLHPLNYNPQKRQNRQDMKNQFVENGAIYITKNSSFIESKCRVSGNIGIFKMSEDESKEIDSEYDLILVEQILKMRDIK
jgi:N-acylneuraminate cytidylyltransferase